MRRDLPICCRIRAFLAPAGVAAALLLVVVPASATPLRFEMVFDDRSWSGYFVVDADTRTSSGSGSRWIYVVTSFEITNGVHVFDQNDTWDAQDDLGAVEDLHGNFAFYEYVQDDESDAIAQPVYSVMGLPDDYEFFDTWISYSVGCPPTCFSPDFSYRAVLVPEPGTAALLFAALAGLGWGRRSRRIGLADATRKRAMPRCSPP